MVSSKCFVPECKTGYKSDIKQRKMEGKRSPSLFRAPRDEDKLKKWRRAIPRADKELNHDDRVCELHFLPEDICTHDVHKMPDGIELRMERERKTLVNDAIPTIFPNLPSYLSKYKSKRKAPAKREPLTKKPRTRKSNINDIPKIANTAMRLFTFKDLVDNLAKVKKSHTLWTLSSHVNFIVCVKWDDVAAPEKQIVVNNNLSFKVLYYGTEVPIRPNYAIDSVENLSRIITEVENYEVCPGTTNERADKKPTNDQSQRLCQFKNGKKENVICEGKQFEQFPDPEKRFRRKVLIDLEDAANPDGFPSLNLEHCFLHNEGKVQERKQNFKKNLMKDDKTSSTDKEVDLVEIESTMATSSSYISESDSNSEDFHLEPYKIGNTTIYRNLPATVISSDVLSPDITTENILLAENRSEHSPLTITNYIPSTTLTPADVPFRTDKSVNSSSILHSTIEIESEDNLESIQEDDSHEIDVDFMPNQSLDSASESNIITASDQINDVTHAEAFYAAQTLVQYMMKQDDVGSTDINFMLNLAQKIKERLSVKKEKISEDL